MFFFAACGNHNKIKAQSNVDSLDANVDFQDVFTKVLKTNCLECHNTYDNYQIVFKQKDRILDAVLSGRMPKGKSPLSGELRTTLQSWIKNGAPEEQGVISKGVPLEPSFDSLLVNVFAPKCLSCHSGDPNAPGPVKINFSTYKDLIASNDLYIERNKFGLFDPEDPENSEIVYLVTASDEEEPMPPLKLKGNPNYVSPGRVTEAELKVMIEWIKKGFPKN